MILAIDVGNTRLKWGLHDGVAWCTQGALELGAITDLAAQLSQLSDHSECAVVANVAGVPIRDALAAQLEKMHIPVRWLRSQRSQCGVVNSYLDPAQLGVDRWAALIGARRLQHGPCLVVMAGTATTVDVLDADGVFQGGLILPGVELMRGALARNTAQLTLEAGVPQTLPRSTPDAIASGCLLAQAGAVERMFEFFHGAKNAVCLVSGGAAPLLLEHLRIAARQVENLVLEGLIEVARHPSPQPSPPGRG